MAVGSSYPINGDYEESVDLGGLGFDVKKGFFIPDAGFDPPIIEPYTLPMYLKEFDDVEEDLD